MDDQFDDQLGFLDPDEPKLPKKPEQVEDRNSPFRRSSDKELVHNEDDLIDLNKIGKEEPQLVHGKDELVNIGEDWGLDSATTNKILHASKAVAKIDTGLLGLGSATGFLIKPNLLITSWHTFFDYKNEYDDWQTKEVFSRAAQRASKSKALFGYRQADKFFDPDDDPDKYELDPTACFIPDRDLDYCIVGVKGNPGGLWGSLELPTTKIAKPKIVIIIQHPEGKPQKIALKNNAVIKNKAGVPNSRIRYLADTKPGSSGSPVFDAEMNLVAIHRYGEGDEYSENVENEGVLVASIVKDILNREPDILS